MSYYFSTILHTSFDEAVSRTIAGFGKEGFGVLTDIDMRATMKKKLDADFRQYRILGMCNPPFAYKSLLAEDKIGLMLPCNVVVQDLGDGRVEVAAIDPVASMQAIQNQALAPVALEVRQKISECIKNL